jgi:hypothetical protein
VLVWGIGFMFAIFGGARGLLYYSGITSAEYYDAKENTLPVAKIGLFLYCCFTMCIVIEECVWKRVEFESALVAMERCAFLKNINHESGY